MRKLFIYTMMLFAFSSCVEKTKTKDDVIKEAFETYVKTDFDDPDDFIEVTKIYAIDTLNAIDLKELIEGMVKIQDILTPREIINLADFAEKLDKDTTCIITHVLNVRIKQNGNKSLVNYYVVENGNELKVQDHKLNKEELPELYREFLKFTEKVVDSRLY